MNNSASLVALRSDLLASFSASLDAIGLLDPFQVRGIVAGFWYQTKYDFLTLMARGARGVVDAWRTSIITALEDKASKESPLEHSQQGKPAGARAGQVPDERFRRDYQRPGGEKGRSG